MLAGMNVKFGFLRLYGLADRVLVIDEVHAYDAYMSAIISRLLQWCACLKIPVVLLSATLSAKQRAGMIEAYGAMGGDPGPDAPYPLITVAEAGNEAWTLEANASSSRNLKIETHPGLLGDAVKTAAKAAELVENGGCCCTILNTVKQAQSVYTALKLPANEKLLFHARFTASDRRQITEKVLELFGKDRSNRPTKFVLVATQVVEQSLDVDFDYMISEIAPIDLLLQRSGRMHRHKKRGHDPVLNVLLPEHKSLNFDGTGYVYADKPLLRTLGILASQGEVYLPNDFRELIDCCYGSREWDQSAVEWELIRKADHDWDRETQFLHNQGKQFALCEPSERIFRPVNNDPTGDDSDDGNGWRARTRLGANERTCVLVEERQLQHLEPGDLRMKEVRSLYQRSLKLPHYLPILNPATGYCAGVEAKGKLRGLILLPLANDGLWQGIDENGNRYEVAYHTELGLIAGRLQ
jgi:CRISPR-associated endonuclease/helicase Cas3